MVQGPESRTWLSFHSSHGEEGPRGLQLHEKLILGKAIAFGGPWQQISWLFMAFPEIIRNPNMSCFRCFVCSAGQEAKELGESQPTAGEEGEEEGGHGGHCGHGVFGAMSSYHGECHVGSQSWFIR